MAHVNGSMPSASLSTTTHPSRTPRMYISVPCAVVFALELDSLTLVSEADEQGLTRQGGSVCAVVFVPLRVSHDPFSFMCVLS
jgi:hypothetical protein